LKPPKKRISELDSLRGLAALSVVFLHFQDMFFSYDHYSKLTHRQDLALMLVSPFTRGHEAVLLFFALSGFVLTLAYLQGRQQTYGIFLTHRIIRIYGPYFAALVLSVAGDAIWHGHLGLGNWAEAMWSQPVDPKLVLQHVLFLGNYNWAQINIVFWSLVYEMRISLIFPFLFVLANRLGTRWALVAAAACPFLSYGLNALVPNIDATVVTLNYAAIFVCGIVLAKNRKAVADWYGARNWVQQAGFVICVITFHLTAPLWPRLNGLAALAAGIGWMVLALSSDRAGRWLNHAIPAYLGRISYSLYLVHAPIIFALAFMLRGKISLYLFFGLYLVLAILGGTVFYRLVEVPCLRLTRRVRGATPVAAVSP
jgi:peptidoglycan/LPS O-acetylase OafA/YrhL